MNEKVWSGMSRHVIARENDAFTFGDYAYVFAPGSLRWEEGIRYPIFQYFGDERVLDMDATDLRREEDGTITAEIVSDVLYEDVSDMFEYSILAIDKTVFEQRGFFENLVNTITEADLKVIHAVPIPVIPKDDK